MWVKSMSSRHCGLIDSSINPYLFGQILHPFDFFSQFFTYTFFELLECLTLSCLLFGPLVWNHHVEQLNSRLIWTGLFLYKHKFSFVAACMKLTSLTLGVWSFFNMHSNLFMKLINFKMHLKLIIWIFKYKMTLIKCITSTI